MTERLSGTAGAIGANQAACEAAINEILGEGTDAKTITRTRQVFGEELAEILVSVAALQPKARRKLGVPADHHVWWVTEKSLQQATAWQVARLKSCWFGNRDVFDLCCGAGGDAVHLARRGIVIAVDSDDLMTAMAAANLANAASDVNQVRARCADATTIEIPPDSAVHIDPDRRGGGRRSSRVVNYQPAWDQVQRIAHASMSSLVKLAPAAQIEPEDSEDAHRCWISLSGSVREQSVMRGETVAEAKLAIGTRSAVSLSADSSESWFAPPGSEIDSANAKIATQPREILIDPDAAIRAAGLTETFACRYRCELLGSPAGFLTADQFDQFDQFEQFKRADDPSTMAVIGRVFWTGSCDDRKLRRELRSRDCFPAVVKVRGTDHDPSTLVRRYRKCGQRPVTLWITRPGDRVVAALTQ